MTEFMANEGGDVVDITPTLEADQDDTGHDVMYLGIPVENEAGRTIGDWITDDPSAIDEFFRTVAELHAQWNEHYHGIVPPGGHVVPLGSGNSGPGR